VETGSKKIKTTHNIIDEAFGSSDSSYHLSLQLGSDGLCFCILDLDSNKYLVLRSYQFDKVFNWSLLANELDAVIKQDDLLIKKYRSVSVMIVNDQFTIVPSPLFDSSRQKDYLKFNTAFDNDAVISNDALKVIEARNIYAIPREVERIIRKNYGACKIIHSTSALIESLINRNKNSSKKQLFVNMHLSSFDLVLINGNKFEYCNTFRYQSDEDFIYYLLFVCEQLKLNPENIHVFLAGETGKTALHYTLLYKYIRNISFLTRNEGFAYSYKFDEIPAYRYYNLLHKYSG
jgi:hypothetical protein